MELNLLQSIFLGIVQGLTEFIPVSSSGHLQILPDILGWASPSTSFILFSHIGTLLALLIYFRAELIQYAKSAIAFVTSKVSKRELSSNSKQDVKILANILLASIPAGLLGVIVSDSLEAFYTNEGLNPIPTAVTALAMLLLGVFFLFAEKVFTGKKVTLEKTTWKQAVIIGIAQVLAFLRGVSRSGITLLVGEMAGLSRVAAAKFSFLMSIPILFATSVFAVWDTIKGAALDSNALTNGIAAAIAAFIFGYIAVRFLISYLQKQGLAIFGWYRIIFAAFVLLLVAL